MKKLFIIILLLTSCSKNMPYEPSQGALDSMNETVEALHTIDDVKAFMLRFVPDEDLALLEPTIEVIFANNFHGDCKTAAIMAQWACEIIGYDAILVDVWEYEIGKALGHQICIAWNKPDEWHLFSNNEYGLINAGDWRTPVLEYFNNRYHKIDIN